MIDPRRTEAELSEFFAMSDATILAAWLFGSVARGTPTARSDVDVAVLLRDPPNDAWRVQFDLEAALERRLRLPVQVVVTSSAPVDLLKRVLRDGHLLLDRDPAARALFELRVRQEFFDLEPLLARYRAAPRGWDE